VRRSVKKQLDARVKEIMRKKLAEKGIVMDEVDESKLTEEEKKKRFDAKVKEIMRQKK